jgi:hypothetical protein
MSEPSKVICQICKKRFNSISPTHLRLHNITMEEYRTTYPDYALRSQFSPETIEKQRQAKKKWWSEGNWTEEMHQRRSEIASRINIGRKLSKKVKKKFLNLC